MRDLLNSLILVIFNNGSLYKNIPLYTLVKNNAINEIKNTLEGTNSRIMEAEDRISEVEDRMVEMKQRGEKKKELKEIRIITETSGTMLNTPTFKS